MIEGDIHYDGRFAEVAVSIGTLCESLTACEHFARLLKLCHKILKITICPTVGNRSHIIFSAGRISDRQLFGQCHDAVN